MTDTPRYYSDNEDAPDVWVWQDEHGTVTYTYGDK